MSRRRAVITGIGPITCIGNGVEGFWNGILAEKSGISRISTFDPQPFQVRCAGEISDWNAEHFSRRNVSSGSIVTHNSQ